MASTAFLPEGASFKIGDGASPTEAFTSVANIKSISLSGGEAEEIDVTNLASTGGYKEFIAGFKDAGQIELGLHFNPDEATHVGGSKSLMALFASGDVFNWKIVFDTPAGDVCTISGAAFIKSEPQISLSPTSPLEGTVTIRRTGATTIAVA